MPTPTLNYFTCTLGQAAIWKRQSNRCQTSVNTILELIERQASLFPQSLAIGFADSPFKETPDKSPVLTFRQLHDLSIAAARTLMGVLPNEDNSRPRTRTEQASKRYLVALLCTSSIQFIITYLGLIRLGCVVLLVASVSLLTISLIHYTDLSISPQLEPPAIQHLCNTCGVKLIFVDELQAPRLARLRDEFVINNISDYHQLDPNSVSLITKTRHWESCDPVHIFHTSGTSSGLPKPIVQTHWAAVGVLPFLADDVHVATFSTTPLYHGGLADCFRSWTNASMIWFFPEGVRPITCANIVEAVMSTRAASIAEVKYFTGVPYVLQLLEEQDSGIQLLQTMDLVGVGGAALAPLVGNNLTKAGVKLISRMGSAECGFLMSSDRDFATDKEWQYLRPVEDLELLSFEPRGHGLYELVAKPGWPFKAKVNRQDGSYATSDLFEPHPTLSNAWRYHSRADSQITLASGKKFDPSPIEASILASCRSLEDILVFGTGKPYPGALLFPKNDEESDYDIINCVWPAIDRLNRESQNHARLSRHSVVVVKVAAGLPRLEKSSKGTIMRHYAQDRYIDIIESVYVDAVSLLPPEHISDDEVLTFTADKFAQVLGRKIDPHEDVFQQGVDSIACIQIRNLIQSSMISAEAHVLPPNIIYEQGTIGALAAHIIQVRRGTKCAVGVSPGSINESLDSKQMTKMVEKYGNFQFYVTDLPPKSTKNILLTGATGFLGAHILHLLRETPTIHKIYCLVRAQTPARAYERVSKALSESGMPGLVEPTEFLQTRDKIVCLPWDLSDSKLGLDDEQKKRIMRDCTTCIHAAWPVNFSLRLKSFEEHLFGLHNLLALTISAGVSFVFISSTAAVINTCKTPISETISYNPLDASPLGYSQSKWAAEQICTQAHDACLAAYTGNDLECPVISVFRVGQLCGNYLGIWNASEAYPLMLSTAKLTRCLPNLATECLDWLPVDQAAQAVLEIALTLTSSASTRDARPLKIEPPTPVYHILNPHTTPAWNDVMHWLINDDNTTYFQVVSPAEWVDCLERCLREVNTEHPAQKLLAFWKDSFHTNHTNESYDVKNEKGDMDSRRRRGNGSKFNIVRALRESHTVANLRPLDHNQVIRLWRWIECEVR